MIDLEIMKDASEIVHYDEMGITIYIRRGVLSDYPDMRALSHWHADIEWIYINDGVMNFEVNGKIVLLSAGDCIMVNSKQLHYGFSKNHMECHFINILFQPAMLYGNEKLAARFVNTPINLCPEYIVFKDGETDTMEFARILNTMICLKEESFEKNLGQILDAFRLLWEKTIQFIFDNESVYALTDNTDLNALKAMISFIQQNYSHIISLDEIALSGAVSRSKCCRLFKRLLDITPNEYLNTYRLEIAAYLLRNSSSSVTQIAISCGFNHVSYFTKSFSEKYNLTPRKYRQHHDIKNG